MDIILKTIKNGAILTTVYDKKENLFKVIYIYEGQAKVLEKFKKPEVLAETHDFWCKIVGIINLPIPQITLNKYMKEHFDVSFQEQLSS